MGCGCNKGTKKSVVSPPSGRVAISPAEATTFDVIGADGMLVASSSNITFARVEARRTGGTVVPRKATSASQA